VGEVWPARWAPARWGEGLSLPIGLGSGEASGDASGDARGEDGLRAS
jgi:hypothetical protein